MHDYARADPLRLGSGCNYHAASEPAAWRTRERLKERMDIGRGATLAASDAPPRPAAALRRNATVVQGQKSALC
jgi:hypothetical protein